MLRKTLRSCPKRICKFFCFPLDIRVTQAVEAGVNCMDLYTPDPDLRSRVGRALRGRREQFVLQAHLCTVWQNGQYKATRDIGEVRASFEDVLRRLETDYIDVGMIHYVDTMDTWNTVANGEVMRYALEQKRAGRIRCIGLSSHNPEVALAAVESGLVEVLMFSVNPCYDLQRIARLCGRRKAMRACW